MTCPTITVFSETVVSSRQRRGQTDPPTARQRVFDPGLFASRGPECAEKFMHSVVAGTDQRPAMAVFSASIAATGGATAGSGPSLSFAITPAAPNRLMLQVRPSPTATAGQPFAVQPVVYEEDRFGNVETNDNSTVVTAVIASGTGPLQGTVTAAVSRGVATFTNLADSSGGTISLEFESGSLAPETSFSITVAASGPAGGGTTPPTPEIKSASVLATRKTNKKGKPVGKPVFTGFILDFSTAMNPATAGLAANYHLSSAVIRRVKKRKVTVLQPVNVTVAYNPSAEAVTLTMQGKPKFTDGGQLKVIAASPNGGSSAAGVLLDANDTVLSIQPKARGITP